MATNTNISKKRKFVADGLFYAELNEFLQVRRQRQRRQRQAAEARQMATHAQQLKSNGDAMRCAGICHLTVVLFCCRTTAARRTSLARTDMPAWRCA